MNVYGIVRFKWEELGYLKIVIIGIWKYVNFVFFDNEFFIKYICGKGYGGGEGG